MDIAHGAGHGTGGNVENFGELGGVQVAAGADLDSCIAIRTMLMQKKKAFLQAGAGIVADSDPAREFEESMNKAQAVLRAVEAARGSR